MWADNASKLDMLAYKPYAELIYEISNNKRMNPLTIGLFGTWGSGKSTLLGLLEDKLKTSSEDKDGIVVISLNAWMFEGYDDAKTAIMESLLKAIECNSKISDEFKGGFKKLINRVNWLRVAGTAAKYGVPIAMGTMMGNPIPAVGALVDGTKSFLDKKENIDKAQKVVEEHLNEEESIIDNVRVFREEFEKQLIEAKISNLIVMIDDLDRCNPDRILDTLEAIKLFLSVKRTTFIVAIDERVVTYAIKRKYPKLSEEGKLDVSNDYIEKIIQLPIRLPRLSEIDIKNYILLLICEMFLKDEVANQLMEELFSQVKKLNVRNISSRDILTRLVDMKGDKNIQDLLENTEKLNEFKEHLKIFENIADIISGTLRGNPRQAKRFLNTFHIRKRMSEIQNCNLDLGILAKLMVLEELDKSLFNELYVWQLENDGVPDKLKELYNSITDGTDIKDTEYNNWNKQEIKHWIIAEPTNIYETDLSDYFYLSRDSINEVSLTKNILTAYERRLVDDICEADDNTYIRKLIANLKNEEQSTVEKVVNTTIVKFRKNHKILFVLLYVYEEFDRFKNLLVNEFLNIKSEDLSMSNLMVMQSLSKKGDEQMRNLMAELKKQGILDERKQKALEQMTN